MHLPQWMKERHSVRAYDGKALSASLEAELRKKIEAVNKESGQHFQLLVNEPKAFSSNLAHYGSFSDAVNYIALVGDSEIRLGYYGEEIVHFCFEHDLKTCWVCLTFKKMKNLVHIPAGCKMYGVIAVGTSSQNGTLHTLRDAADLISDQSTKPDWFMAGMEGVRYAPSALNQQKYRFRLENGKPAASKGLGFYTGLDLGIAGYHFDQACHHDYFRP